MPLLLLEGEKIFIPLGEKIMMSMKKILSIILISILAISAPISAVNATNYGQFCNYTHDNHTIQFYDNNESVRAGVQEIIDSGVYYIDASGIGGGWWTYNVTGATIVSIYRQEIEESPGHCEAGVRYIPYLLMPDGSISGILWFSTQHPQC
jgi:hypothetical protein